MADCHKARTTTLNDKEVEYILGENLTVFDEQRLRDHGWFCLIVPDKEGNKQHALGRFKRVKRK